MTSRFDLSDTPLAGLKVLKRKRLGDARGYLTRLFDAEELTEIGWPDRVAQINETGTAKAGMIVAETLRRNRKMTMITSEIAIASVSCTFQTAARIEIERSNSGCIWIAGGTCARI